MSTLSKKAVIEDLANNKKSFYDCFLKRNSMYKGIGTDEYKSYCTNDNGKTWDIVPTSDNDLIISGTYPVGLISPGVPVILYEPYNRYPAYNTIPPKDFIEKIEVSISEEDNSVTITDPEGNKKTYIDKSPYFPKIIKEISEKEPYTIKIYYQESEDSDKELLVDENDFRKEATGSYVSEKIIHPKGYPFEDSDIRSKFGQAPYSNYTNVLKSSNPNIIILYSSDGDSDGAQPVYSTDGGLTWYDIEGLSGIRGPFTGVTEDDNGWTLTGDNGNVYIDKYGNGSLLGLGDIDISFDKLELLYVINNVLVPQMSYQLTGNKSIEVFQNTTLEGDIQTYGNQILTGIYTNLNSFEKLDINSDVFIDWETDFGMRALNQEDVLSTLSSSSISSVPLNNFLGDLNTNESQPLKETMEDIRTYLNIRKNVSKSRISALYNEQEIEADLFGVAEKYNTSDENFENACKLLALYKNVTVHSMTTIMFTILDTIYYFSDEELKALIIAAIYETILDCAGKVNNTILTIKEKAAKIMSGELESDESLSIFNAPDGTQFVKVRKGFYTFSYDFSRGLLKAVNKYIDASINSIIKLTQKDDKDIISIAAGVYKDKRPSIIVDIEDAITKININDCIIIDNYSLEYDNIDEIFKKCWNNYIESVRNSIDNLDLSIYNPSELMLKENADNKRALEILSKAFTKAKDRSIQLLDLVKNNNEEDYNTYINNLIDKKISEEELKKEIMDYIKRIVDCWKDNKGNI